MESLRKSNAGIEPARECSMALGHNYIGLSTFCGSARRNGVAAGVLMSEIYRAERDGSILSVSVRGWKSAVAGYTPRTKRVMSSLMPKPKDGSELFGRASADGHSP